MQSEEAVLSKDFWVHHNFVGNALLAKNLFSMFSMVVKI